MVHHYSAVDRKSLGELSKSPTPTTGATIDLRRNGSEADGGSPRYLSAQTQTGWLTSTYLRCVREHAPAVCRQGDWHTY